MTLLEPAVALTDFAIAIECAVFVSLLIQYRTGPLRLSFVTLFLATGFAALLGGISHGFLSDTETAASRLVWRATLVSICCAALASWIVSARLLLHERRQKIAISLAILAFAVEIIYILFVGHPFTVAIVSYTPAAILLLAAFCIVYRRRPASFLLAGIIGLALTFVAAVVQLFGIGVHPHYFDHNALYHAIQGAAFVLIFLTARGLIHPQ